LADYSFGECNLKEFLDVWVERKCFNDTILVMPMVIGGAVLYLRDREYWYVEIGHVGVGC